MIPTSDCEYVLPMYFRESLYRVQEIVQATSRGEISAKSSFALVRKRQ